MRNVLKAVNAHPQMIFELAAGLDDELQIARKYDVSEDALAELRADPAFVKAVESKRGELRDNGYVFRTKARLIAEDLLADLYVEAKDGTVPFNQRLELVRTMIKSGDLDPKPERGDGLPTFQINIDMSGGMTLTASPNGPARAPAADVVDVAPLKTPAKEFDNALNQLDFLGTSLNADLAYAGYDD